MVTNTPSTLAANEISLTDALRLIDEASAILLPDESSALTHPSVGEVTGVPENEVLTLEWAHEIEDISKTFLEGPNTTVKIANGGLQMIDEIGELITIHIQENVSEEELKNRIFSKDKTTKSPTTSTTPLTVVVVVSNGEPIAVCTTAKAANLYADWYGESTVREFAVLDEEHVNEDIATCTDDNDTEAD